MKKELGWVNWELDGLVNWWGDSVENYGYWDRDYFEYNFKRTIEPGLLYKSLENNSECVEDEPGRFEIPVSFIRHQLNKAYRSDVSSFYTNIVYPAMVFENGSHKKDWEEGLPSNVLLKAFCEIVLEVKEKTEIVKILTDELNKREDLPFSFSRYQPVDNFEVPEWVAAFASTADGFKEELKNRRFYISWRPIDVLGMSHKISGSCYRAGGEYATAPLLLNSSSHLFVAYTTRTTSASTPFRVKTSRLMGFDIDEMVLTGRIYKHGFIQLFVNLMTTLSGAGNLYLASKIKQSSQKTLEANPFDVISSFGGPNFYGSDWESSRLTYSMPRSNREPYEMAVNYFKTLNKLHFDLNSLKFYSAYRGAQITIHSSAEFYSSLEEID